MHCTEAKPKQIERGAPLRQAARTSALVLRSRHASLTGWPARPCGPQPRKHHKPDAAQAGICWHQYKAHWRCCPSKLICSMSRAVTTSSAARHMSVVSSQHSSHNGKSHVPRVQCVAMLPHCHMCFPLAAMPCGLTRLHGRQQGLAVCIQRRARVPAHVHIDRKDDARRERPGVGSFARDDNLLEKAWHGTAALCMFELLYMAWEICTRYLYEHKQRS